jgi:hypothetical protein
MKYVNQKIAMIYTRYISTRSEQYLAVTHVKRNESEDNAQVAPVITVFNVEPRGHILVSGRVRTVLAALRSPGVCDVSTSESDEWIHVLAAGQTLRRVDGD